MTKNIALVVNELTADYTQEIITSISDFYRGKNVNFIVSQVKLPFQKGAVRRLKYRKQQLKYG